MNTKIIFIPFLALFFLHKITIASNGDTVEVISHQNVTVVTNPATGSNEYKNWAVFPAQAVKYRKVLVSMEYRCPNGLSCGEWDYIDRLMLRRTGGVNQNSEDIELVRFITPYGLTFNNTWNFKWEMDITDFGFLLHDSVEIGYIHTGYETNVGRGWNVTLRFMCIEGSPSVETIGITRLWDGTFAYGNDNNPINTQLNTVNLNTMAEANMLRFRMNHTGHGMNNPTGCSEFCDRYRKLIFDNNVAEQTSVWRKCGDNAVYPQGGTWVYDRGGWCPGATVYPVIKDFLVEPGSAHSVKLDMQDYSFEGTQANENIIAYMLHQKKPVLQNDAAIAEIISPTIKQEYLRLNPVCMNPVIVLENKGANSIKNVQIQYGYQNEYQFTYTYPKSIESLGLDTVELPATIVPSVNNAIFRVFVKQIDGSSANYTYDDTLTSRGALTAAYTDSIVILDFRTNNEGVESGYKLFNHAGEEVYSRPVGSCANLTNYIDTFKLHTGCYKLEFYDVDEYGGDGLQFWANSEAGSGHLRLKKPTGQFLRIFPNDFGSITRFSFTVGSVITNTPEIETDEPKEVYLFPNPNKGSFNLSFTGFSMNIPVNIEVFDSVGKLVYQQQAAPGIQEINTEKPLSSGFYLVQVSQGYYRKVVKMAVK